MSGHTLKIKINPGKLDQVAAQFPDAKRFVRLVTAIDNEDRRTTQFLLQELQGWAAARYIVAVLQHGFASCDEVSELLKPLPTRAG